MAFVYVNPFTDYGFKKIFGEEANKDILMDFLNALLNPRDKITELSFRNNSQLGERIDAKGVIFDIYCQTETGEQIIIELQKSKQNWFKERTIYYSTFPIREQIEKGELNYNLKAVFCIGILDFVFDDYQTDEKEWLHQIKLKNQRGETFYEKLTYIYLEMPNFNKSEQELTNRLDKWLYFIKHLSDFQQIPLIFGDEVVFRHAFSTAEIARFNKAQLESYEYSMKGYRDLKNVLETAEETGFGKGFAQGEKQTKIKTATKCLKMNMPIEEIAELTDLSIEEIQNLVEVGG